MVIVRDAEFKSLVMKEIGRGISMNESVQVFVHGSVAYVVVNKVVEVPYTKVITEEEGLDQTSPEYAKYSRLVSKAVDLEAKLAKKAIKKGLNFNFYNQAPQLVKLRREADDMRLKVPRCSVNREVRKYRTEKREEVVGSVPLTLGAKSSDFDLFDGEEVLEYESPVIINLICHRKPMEKVVKELDTYVENVNKNHSMKCKVFYDFSSDIRMKAENVDIETLIKLG